MNPGRVWKTLTLHGPMTARQIAARWAVVDEADVYPSAERRVLDACQFLRGFRRWPLVETEDADGDVNVYKTVWKALPRPDDEEYRRELLWSIERGWRKEQRRKRPV